MSLTYGPVPSRRFGLSLGIDLIPHKVCSYDCVYCQLGRTTEHTLTRRAHVEPAAVIDAVARALERGPRPDVLTLAGSGEPTLYAPLAELNRTLRREFGLPLLLITNGATLWQPEVAEAALETDILAPSLDAGDERTWRRLDRPPRDLSYDTMLRGLQEVTHAHPGTVRVEVMLVHRVNDSEASLQALAAQLATLRADRIDLNTPVRPPVPERGALPASEATLQRAVELFGPRAVPVGRFVPRDQVGTAAFNDLRAAVLGTLQRRPCTAGDLQDALGLHHHEVSKILQRLRDDGQVVADGAYWRPPEA